MVIPGALMYTGITVLVVIVLMIAVNSARSRGPKIRNGVNGSALVVSVEARKRLADSPQGYCTMNLIVSGAGIQPTAVLYQRSIFSHLWPEPGMTLPCTFDPAKPSDVAIDWQSLPSKAELDAANAHTIQQQMRGIPVTDSDDASPLGTLVASLEQLADLRDQGLLTSEQFAEQKLDLLNSQPSGA